MVGKSELNGEMWIKVVKSGDECLSEITDYIKYKVQTDISGYNEYTWLQIYISG